MEVKITDAVYIKVDWSYATLSSSCLEESETDAAHGWRGETLSLVQSLNRVYLYAKHRQISSPLSFFPLFKLNGWGKILPNRIKFPRKGVEF